jgi:hypothetical protein
MIAESKFWVIDVASCTLVANFCVDGSQGGGAAHAAGGGTGHCAFPEVGISSLPPPAAGKRLHDAATVLGDAVACTVVTLSDNSEC